MEVPPARWTNATRQILVLGRQAPRKFSHPLREKKSQSLSLLLLVRTISFHLSPSPFPPPPALFSLPFYPSPPAIRHFTPALTRERVRGQGRPWKGKENGSGRTSEKFSSKIEFDTFRRYFIPIFVRSIGVYFTRKISYVTISI